MNEDLSSLFEKLNINKDSISPDMINNLASMLNNKSNNSNSSSNSQKEGTSNSSTSNIDFETIMKMKTIIDKMNVKDDPRSNLLLSLKPYLKESRREKLDQYIQLMNISKALDFFPFLGGDKQKNGKQ
ncbi:MAG: hypothetical protein ACI4VE_06410 [Clostridia bacterium]